MRLRALQLNVSCDRCEIDGEYDYVSSQELLRLIAEQKIKCEDCKKDVVVAEFEVEVSCPYCEELVSVGCGKPMDDYFGPCSNCKADSTHVQEVQHGMWVIHFGNPCTEATKLRQLAGADEGSDDAFIQAVVDRLSKEA